MENEKKTAPPATAAGAGSAQLARQQQAAPHAQAEPVLVPKWAGYFHSYQDWVNKAQSRLASPDHRRAMCVDAKGRRCAMGRDFMLARDESAFPVRYFWECELVAAPVPHAQAEPVAHNLRAALIAVRESLQFANDSPNGGINDTLWMMHSSAPETLFDFIDAALAAPVPQEAEQAAPAAVAALSDADVVAVLASLGIDAEPSKYGFDTLQVHTTVPAIRDIVGAYLEFQPAAPAVTDAARDVLADAKGGA